MVSPAHKLHPLKMWTVLYMDFFAKKLKIEWNCPQIQWVKIWHRYLLVMQINLSCNISKNLWNSSKQMQTVVRASGLDSASGCSGCRTDCNHNCRPPLQSSKPAMKTINFTRILCEKSSSVKSPLNRSLQLRLQAKRRNGLMAHILVIALQCCFNFLAKCCLAK